MKALCRPSLAKPIFMAEDDRMRAAFKLFDPDGEGVITQEGLKNTLKTLGKQATDAELRTLDAQAGHVRVGRAVCRAGRVRATRVCTYIE